MTKEEADKQIIEFADKYRDYWKDKDEHYWFARLTQEIGELGGSIVGDHEGPTELELLQIAGISINWLRRGLEAGMPFPEKK